MVRATRLRCGFLASAGLLLFSNQATALSLVPDPLSWDIEPIASVFGTIDVVEVTTGVPTGGTVLNGAIAATDITIVFEHAVDASSEFALPDIRIVPGGTAVVTGSGSIAGPGADVVATGDPEYFQFANPSGFEPGETLDPIFVSFSALDVGDTLRWEFVLVEMGTFTVVPEPGTAVLMTIGLAMAAWRSRNRS